MQHRHDIDPPLVAVKDAVERALAEDLLPLGDLTASLVDPSINASVRLVAREEGVVAGRLCAIETFFQIDASVKMNWHVHDGSVVAKDTVIAHIEGPLRSILTAERTALNFYGHLSGVATKTARIVSLVAAVNPNTRVIDTRKTIPGLRSLQKAAVRAGGGYNHRGNLSEAVLVKDNHLGGISIHDAIARGKTRWPGRMVEVECDTISQACEAARGGATVIMLDNMTPTGAKAAVEAVKEISAEVLIEVSGGINETTAPLYALAGVDLLSVGALTHSVSVLDVGLDLA